MGTALTRQLDLRSLLQKSLAYGTKLIISNSKVRPYIVLVPQCMLLVARMTATDAQQGQHGCENMTDKHPSPVNEVIGAQLPSKEAASATSHNFKWLSVDALMT